MAYLDVEVGDGSASARLVAYVHDANDLIAFFAAIAQDWRGWTGERKWASLESDFLISATSDVRGHFFLRVSLKPQVPNAPWAFQATVPLETGELDRVAAAVRGLNAAG